MGHMENHWQHMGGRHIGTKESSSDLDRVFIIAYRKQRKESQRRFWGRFGVTQSRGSRFESGAHIPEPVSILLGLYFNRTISDGDIGQAGQALHRQYRDLVPARPDNNDAVVSTSE